MRASPMPARLRDAVELVRQQRRVGRDDDDDRAVVALGGGLVPAGPRAGAAPTGTPAIRSAVARAVVRLHEHADGVAPPLHVDAPRGRADAALELVAGHARAAADIALGDRARLRRRRAPRSTCSGLHVKAVDVVQVAVPGLGDDRQSTTSSRTHPGRPACTRQAIVASRTMPTLCVFVSITGPSSRPDSSIQAVPVISPLPFSTKQPREHRRRERVARRAAGSRSRRCAPCGRPRGPRSA